MRASSASAWATSSAPGPSVDGGVLISSWPPGSNVMRLACGSGPSASSAARMRAGSVTRRPAASTTNHSSSSPTPGGRAPNPASPMTVHASATDRRARVEGMKALSDARIAPRPKPGCGPARARGRGASDLRSRCRVIRYGRPSGSPAPLDPLVEVRALGADRGVETVTREHERAGVQREEAAVDRRDDLVEARVLELRVPGTAGEERVAAEEDRVALEEEAGRPGRVAGRVDRVELQVTDGEDVVVGDREVVGRQHLGVGARDPDLDPGVPQGGDRLDVVPVPV